MRRSGSSVGQLLDIVPGGDLAYIELSCRPNVQLASLVREFITQFYRRLFSSRNEVGFVALATHELLENAIRHSVDRETTIRIEVSRDGNSGRGLVSIRTWNRAQPSKIAALTSLIDEMNRVSDPQEFYQGVLKKFSAIDRDVGLGIARVRAEAFMSLFYELTGGGESNDESSVVCVTAMAEVSLGEGWYEGVLV